MARKVKELGQVYTPVAIVNDVLNAAGYSGQILEKHIMENSCGPGAFLVEIVQRYINSYFQTYSDKKKLKIDLETYIHAIDIDQTNILKTIERIDEIVSRYGITNVKWDIHKNDTLTVKEYDGKMDYVVGNPPYVRVHNLEDTYNSVKQYSFAQNGMTDIYIVFFEIGLNMLKEGGVLSYITSSSYYNSLAGTVLRNYIAKTQSVYSIMDLGHYNPFEETTYTTITSFTKGKTFKSIDYYAYDAKTGLPAYVDNIPYKELFVDGVIVLMEGSKSRHDFSKIFTINRSKHKEVQVKNGFATLADSVFISSDFTEDSNIIDVYKGSTGEWKKCIYPYDKEGKLIPFDNLSKTAQKQLMDNKVVLDKRGLNQSSKWYSFGRSQAINDVYRDKVAINILVKDVMSLKIQQIPAGKGIYSGIYIISDYSMEEIENTLRTEDFVKYVMAIKKYKNGGYYTFSTDDLNKYLLYRLCDIRDKQSSIYSFTET